ncbi:hypothetical protein FRACYDRAFT_238343 [Fragilariopsis cylindrus CCMP1102]|uniref:Uncharacterized protein n=1 Tax=Fragilariopsis cylindrus CCMP1102 TaxID=635003 RepID=A0A1E7FJG0_9STRA|nr:hypothetical protein FRACYDRAFT_238343 [Fragilariopsis cylindrus CCMP1102]|eukprot:OEU17913.1 hypothetical protein FRACYDRAFT_238343 [Fragilariopsis cylindrus CCMP1102]
MSCEDHSKVCVFVFLFFYMDFCKKGILTRSLSRAITVQFESSKGSAPDVSEFLYGKLQRATALYGSGLLGPATATINGEKDMKELSAANAKAKGGKEQIQSLNKMLWNQFGMATVEGSIEREDLFWKDSNTILYKPILAELQDTIVFLDVTSCNNQGSGGGGGGGIGGMISSFFPSPKKQELSSTPSRIQVPPPQLDIELIKAAISGGAQIYIVCESDNTKYCVETIKEQINVESTLCPITIVSPDDGVVLNSSSSSSDGNIVNDDKSWSSVRPQDLEGELSQPIYVRDGSFDFDKNNIDKSKSETRIAAASTITTAEKKSSSLSRHNLAEVVVQCSLRLVTTTTAFDDDGFVSGNNPSPIPGVRVVRVSPYPNNNDSKNNLLPAELDERPNADYFSRTGGKIAKAAAGTVTSVDWTETLQCFEKSYNSGRTKTIVKMFPKRPDM